MKYRSDMSIVLVCVVAVFCSAQVPSSAKPPSPLEQTLIAAEKNFIAAAKKHDDAYFKRTLADDYVFVGGDGQLHERHEVLADRSSETMDLAPYNMKVVQAGEGAAVVTYDVILQIPPAEDQGPPPRYQHWTSLWTRQADEWKLKFQQSTPTHWGDW